MVVSLRLQVSCERVLLEG